MYDKNELSENALKVLEKHEQRPAAHMLAQVKLSADELEDAYSELEEHGYVYPKPQIVQYKGKPLKVRMLSQEYQEHLENTKE